MTDYRGFLTAKDSEYLRDEMEYDSNQGHYQRRQSIRERTRAAFRDFTLLVAELDAAEREKIFEPLADGVYHPHSIPGRDSEPPEEYKQADRLKQGILSMLMFAYLGVRDTAIPFNELVEAAIFQTERDVFDRYVDPELTIEDTEPFGAIESAIAKLEADAIADLTYSEQRFLLEFVMHPDRYPPTDERDAALNRLNDLDQFSLGGDTEE